MISAFIKSIRGSDADAGLYWLARMLEAGEDARFIARRLVILASEDVGMADPMALVVADAAARAVEFVGLPEAQLNLAQAVVHLATAPKSNRAAVAIWQAREDVTGGSAGEVPAHLRGTGYRSAAKLGHGESVTTILTTTPGAGSSRSTAPQRLQGVPTTRHQPRLRRGDRRAHGSPSQPGPQRRPHGKGRRWTPVTPPR